jgi:RimJ/RimL family protein N-acetyltransferase
MTSLRPITEADVVVLEGQHDGPVEAGEYSWFGFRDPGSMRRRIANHAGITEDAGVLAVVDDGGTVVGDVSWHKNTNGPPPQGFCWNIGIWIVPEHRRKGHGSEAQRLVASYLFEHHYLERVEAGTEADNIAEQRSLERAGFTREGVLRKSCFRGGEWRDMVVYSKLRGEP